VGRGIPEEFQGLEQPGQLEDAQELDNSDYLPLLGCVGWPLRVVFLYGKVAAALSEL
jgi:hypothetical protein